MALTDQPYLPLYVDDWMNNNKLKLCTPAAHGIMIAIMCIMHKEDQYGKILLKQKFKQNTNQIKNFALQIAKLSAFDFAEIEQPLHELINEKILVIDGDYLVCKRMVKDAEISLKRAKSGRSGGKAAQSSKKSKETLNENFANNFAKAKNKANTVNGIVIENVNENDNKEKGGKGEKQLKYPFTSKAFLAQWDLWKVFRKKQHKFTFLNTESEQRKLTELKNLSGDNEKLAIKIIQQSIDNGWKGFFPLRENTVEQSETFVSNR